jgi:hypothetical protein
VILSKQNVAIHCLTLTLTSIPVWIKLLHLSLEFWSSTCLSHIASGVGKPLYVDKVTEEQQRLGYAWVLVEIDTTSECPKEVFICRENESSVTTGVEYPWLPPKCSVCGGFGHAGYACSKKENKVWVPKKPTQYVVKETTTEVNQQTEKFDKTIKKPLSAAKPKDKNGRIRISNSFDN